MGSIITLSIVQSALELGFIYALVALALYRKITLGIGIQNMELFETNISIMFFSFFLQC